MDAKRTILVPLVAAIVLLAVVAVVSAGCFYSAKRAGLMGLPVSPGYVASAPITVTVSSSGDREEKTWWLSVNSAGQAEVIRSGEHPRTFQVPQEEWDAFRKALERERFFELDAEYGDLVSDGSVQTLTVTADGVTRSVTVHFLTNLPHAERRAADRAARLLRMVEHWIEPAPAAPSG